MAEKKQEQCKHQYFESKSRTQGGIKALVEVRCVYCLKKVDIDSLISKEWQEEQGINNES